MGLWIPPYPLVGKRVTRFGRGSYLSITFQAGIYGFALCKFAFSRGCRTNFLFCFGKDGAGVALFHPIRTNQVKDWNLCNRYGNKWSDFAFEIFL